MEIIGDSNAVSQHNNQSKAYPKPTNSYAIGLCTGALAAAAVASSSSLANLLPAAVHSVIVAFRTGLRAVDVARSTSVEAKSDLSDDWSLLCAGLTIEQAESVIETFASDVVSCSIVEALRCTSNDALASFSSIPAVR